MTKHVFSLVLSSKIAEKKLLDDDDNNNRFVDRNVNANIFAVSAVVIAFN